MPVFTESYALDSWKAHSKASSKLCDDVNTYIQIHTHTYKQTEHSDIHTGIRKYNILDTHSLCSVHDCWNICMYVYVCMHVYMYVCMRMYAYFILSTRSDLITSELEYNRTNIIPTNKHTHTYTCIKKRTDMRICRV